MIDPVAISIFNLNIYWYGINYALSFLIGYFTIIYFGKYFFKNFEKIKDKLLDTYIYSIIFGLIGARLFHVLFFNLNYYLNNPSKIVAVWEGGMAIQGGIIFSLISIYYFSKRYKFSFLNFTDLLTIPFSLALIFGRITNYINQELPGKLTNSIFSINIKGEQRYPYTVIGAFKNFLLFGVLSYLAYFKSLYKKEGFLTAWFLILFNFGRFLIDFFKEPENLIYFLDVGQIIALILGFFGIWLLILMKNNK
jgi:phosphatidylglycerol:prolipoprotein diacylglycerol transferase